MLIMLYKPMKNALALMLDTLFLDQGLLTEGPQFESYPSSLSLPAESGAVHVKLTGVPKEAGLLTIQGI